MIPEISTSRKPAQMVWASVWLDERGRPRRSKLIIMQRDTDTQEVATAHKATSRLLSKVSCLIGAVLSFLCRTTRVYTHRVQPGHGSLQSASQPLNGHLIHRT